MQALFYAGTVIAHCYAMTGMPRLSAVGAHTAPLEETPLEETRKRMDNNAVARNVGCVTQSNPTSISRLTPYTKGICHADAVNL